jgi:hypothetical protein
MKLLTVDIEMAPNIVHRWQLYGNDSTALSQIVQPQEMMCAAWKWGDDSRTQFCMAPAYQKYMPNKFPLDALWEAVDMADAIITYNGKKFDIPRLNTAFLEAGMKPPRPYAQIDLYQVSKREFGFPSNKLDYITNRLLGHGKLSHQGHDLWVACMMGDRDAWETMEKYNREDVVITEELYDYIKAWIPSHPNVLLYGEDPEIRGCPKCGSGHFQSRGTRQLATGIYNQYQCQSCYGWFRDVKRINGSTVR